MQRSSSKWKLAYSSTTALLVAAVTMQMLLWASVTTGSYISGFPGVIEWRPFVFYARSETWSHLQVMALYLLPYLVFVLTFIILSYLRNFIKSYSRSIRLFYGWFFVLLTTLIFFLPLWEILYKQGFYYALSWLGFSRIEQFVFGLLAMFGYFYYMFKSSKIFSHSLSVPSNEILKQNQIISQLLYIWYIPVIVFSTLLLIVSGMKILFPGSYLLAGIFVTILINSPYFSRYSVIIK